MWNFIVRLILRNRLFNLIAILLITAFMGFYAWRNLELSYQMARMLPESDSTYIKYQNFKKQFGEDGSVLFVGIKDKRIYSLPVFNQWYDLTYRIKNLEGVEEVVSIAKMYQLVKNPEKKKIDFKPVIPVKPTTQSELDSLKQNIFSLPFYNGLLYNENTGATIMAVTLDKEQLDTKNRVTLLKSIKGICDEFGRKNNIDIHYSGLPYIRTVISKKVEDELKFFILMALLVTSIALLCFFRSFKAVLFPMIIVVIGVIWALGIISLFGYKITILTSIIPPLIIVIGVENCIFFLNKYHYEFRLHGNKTKSLSRTVQRIGKAAFLTNLATAAGFATFVITGNKILVEFGVVSSINIICVYLLSLFLVPIFFSYFDPPNTRHIKHLDNKFTLKIVEKIVYAVSNRRSVIYVTAVIFAIIGIIGVTRLKTTGCIVDDVPKKDPLYVDLMFFEKEFKGILPFEISIDTKKRKGVMQLSTIRKINELQDTLATYPEFSKPLSIAEVVKFAKQAFYNGKESYYDLPDNSEKGFILSYVPKMKKGEKTILNSFVDTNLQLTRISVQMANIGTRDIQRIKDDLKPKIDSIFNPKDYNVEMTGTSVVFLKGSDYLVNNLADSLIFAIIIITVLLATLFTSARIVGVSLIPNLLPQLLTAALMGYLFISLKPSTVLIFSIALGISVDNAILYLSRFRLELKGSNWNIKDSVIAALRETSYSMIYSSIVLFLGFSIFTLSSFGGTQALGFLVSFTLFIAILSNLLLLPSLLLSLDKRITTKQFEEPLLNIDIFDENGDAELPEEKTNNTVN